MSRRKLSFILIFLVSYVVTSANGANILGVFTSHSPSHVIVHQSIANVLAERGHNVTVVVSDQPKIKVHKDITVIVIPPTKEEEDILNKTILNMVSDKMRLFAMLKTMVSSMSMFIELQAKMLRDPRFTVLYDNPDTKFDLVICGFFFNTYQLGVAAKFKAPVIVTWTSAPMVMVEQLVGSPTGNAALMGSLENHTKFRAFLQRVQNFFTSVFFKIMNIVMDIRMRSYYK